jgi:hypothetical protein
MSVNQVITVAMTAGLIGATMITALVMRDVWPSIAVQLMAIGTTLSVTTGAEKAAAAASLLNVLILFRAIYLQGRRSRTT